MRVARRVHFLAAVPLLFSLTLAQSDCPSSPAGDSPEGQARAAAQEPPPPRSPERAEQALLPRVRRELLRMPFYSVWDWIEFRVDGYQVTLSGYTIRPTIKSEAEARVRRLEGVERVVNNIEVLPTSFHDDRLRRAAFRAIYSRAPLQKYANQPIPAIHIIVRRGHIILEGVVLNRGDRDTAGIAAHTVPGAFSVTNNLRTET